MSPEEAKQRVLEFTRRPFAAVAALEDPDGKGARLLEPGTAKELRLRWDEVAQAEERSSPLRRAPYLVLGFQDGPAGGAGRRGLCVRPQHGPHWIVARFARDFLFCRLPTFVPGDRALLSQKGRDKEALGAILMSIALLDGARAAGLEVGARSGGWRTCCAHWKNGE